MLPITSILLIVSLPALALGRGISSQYASPNMDKSCGKTIVLDGDKLPGTYFSLSSANYDQNLDCTLTIKAPTVNQRVIVVVDKMDIACGDKLIIYDGKKDPSSILNKDAAQQCGASKYYVRTAATNTAILEFVSNNDGKVGHGFNLNAAINFPVATCSRANDFYRCSNNYCISNIFNCDDRNWCGDNSQVSACG